LGGSSALVQLIVAGGVGAAVYIGLCVVLRIEALGFFTQAILRKVRGQTTTAP
jgi:hypothetical protein